MSSISLLKEKAESGDIKAMRELGMAYMEGNGVEKDMDAVFKWIEKAAEHGDAESQADLADMLRTIESFDEALSWDQKAAEQGWAPSQHNLAVCYKDGIGTPVNLEKQFYWYQKAAENGNVLSQLRLSRCYLQGDGTPQDFQQSVYWLQQASDKGNAEAKRRLGAAYHEGIGVEIDKEKGLELLREAVSLGDKTAEGLLKEAQGSARGTKRSLIGMIAGRFFDIIGDEFDLVWKTAKGVGAEALREKGFGSAVGNFIGGLLFSLLFRTPVILFKTILCPFVVTYEYLTDK